jgi:hypothetical protein
MVLLKNKGFNYLGYVRTLKKGTPDGHRIVFGEELHA